MTWSPDILSQGEIHALREAAERAWGEDTRDPVFQGATPAAGQCYNTSRWLQERLGGSVGRVHGHYVWMSPDHQYVLDLTGDQFGGDQMLYKPISHHVFAETQPLDPEEIQMIDGPDTDMFVKRANREFEGLGSTISKIALDYAGDAYPAEMPQRAQDLSDPYFHREQPYEQPSKGEYNFVYANDQVEVSPFHDHEDLAQQAGIDMNANGPIAVGYINVDMGMANFQVTSNVGAKVLSKVLKDYCDRVGWKWGGMTDIEGEPVGTGSEFAPSKSSKTVRYRYTDGRLYVGHRDADLVREAAKHTSEDYIASSLFGEAVITDDFLHIGKTYRGPRFFVTSHREDLEGLVAALQEYSADLGLILVSGLPGDGWADGKGGVGNNVLKRIEDLELHNNADPNPQDDDDHQYPGGPEDEREPSGVYKCRDCSILLPTWRAYITHRKEHEMINDHEPEEDGGFPEMDPDATFPPHFTPQQPEVFPVASVQEARRVDGFKTYAKAFDFDNDDHRHYVAFRAGSPIGFASISNDGELKAVHVNEPVTHHIMNRVRRDYGELHVREGRAFDEGWLKHAQFNKVSKSTWRYSQGKTAADDLDQAVPFIYDIQEDNIAVGEPGTTTSQIDGRFTPGGIVEGTYEPGGKVYINTMTNMPYSVRHIIDLWYWQHPELEVRSLVERAEDGKERKLATEIVEEPAPERTRPTAIKGLDERRPWVYDSRSDKLHVGAPGTHHADIPVKGRGCVLGYIMNNGEVEAYPDPYLASTPEIKEQGLAAAREYSGVGTKFRFAADMTTDIGTEIQTITAADPAASQAARALIQAGGNVFVVGGAVRDAVMGKTPKDIDLMVQGIDPETVRSALDALPGRLDFTGKDFGVFRVRMGEHEVEVALPRRERSTGDAHKDFDVQADHTMKPEQDLYRRDFTANAMAVNLATGELLDPYHGSQDIAEGKLRTVHEHALAEDPLRTVRALVAHGRHGLEPTEGTRAQMAVNADKLKHLPADRIYPELDKIMRSPNPAGAIRLAHETGVLAHILPEVDAAFGYDQNNPHHEHELGDHLLAVLDRAARITDDPDVRLAALLHDVGKPASAWEDPETGKNHFYYDKATGKGAMHEEVGAEMARDRLTSLRFPGDRVKRVEELIKHHMFAPFQTPKGARRFVNRVGDHAEDLLNLREADDGGKGKANPHRPPIVQQQREMVQQIRNEGQATDRSALAINGNDIAQLGYQGPEIGAVLKRLTDAVVDDPSVNNRETLLEMARG